MAVFEHGEAVDADAEGEAADFFGVVVHEAVDGGIDHAGSEELDPGGAFAFRTRSPPAAVPVPPQKGQETSNFDGRLGDGNSWAGGAFSRWDKKLFHEYSMVPVSRRGDVRVDGEAFDLMKRERVRGVGIVAAIDLAGYDDAHRRLLLSMVRICMGDVCVRRRSGVFAPSANRRRTCPCRRATG